jgi:hypothetical protein
MVFSLPRKIGEDSFSSPSRETGADFFIIKTRYYM